ncbi:MAG: hypothetical protein GY801_07265, partial [bacterium]|nr:hypothetical protein [bacterium]
MEETRQLGRNDKSLQQIARTIQLSEGQFALIPARCNYRGLQARLLRRLEDLVSGDIREIRLPEQTRALYSFLQAQSEQDAAPQALFVSGLETLKALPEVLEGANQMREEFSKGFAFPLILWVTDWTLEQFSRQAPDLKNWAGAPVSFELPAGDAQETLRRNTQNALDEAESSEEPLLCDLSRPREFEAFREEQESRIAEWPPELQADWRIFLAIHEKDRAKALDVYRQSLSFWEERGERRRQGFLLNRIGEVYERAEEWHKLETLAERALELNEQCGNERQIAESRRLTAGLALSRKAWQRAADSARKALENTSNPEVRLRTRLMLAQALQGLQQTQEALTLLEEGAEERPEKYAPQPAIRRLELLYDLYRSQKKYLQAFYAKQERLSLEQQFGLRAFIGAGRLKARQTPGADADRAVSLEIQASGRQLTLNHLFGRLETKKLLVLHGESGVGKSSLLEAGLLPLLENTSLGGREALPLLIRNYEDWSKALVEALSSNIVELRESSSPTLPERKRQFPSWEGQGVGKYEALEPTPAAPSREGNLTASPQAAPPIENILAALRWNGEHNRTTVLIFDQFEEFFFAYPRQEERRAFYAFLQCCLDDK